MTLVNVFKHPTSKYHPIPRDWELDLSHTNFVGSTIQSIIDAKKLMSMCISIYHLYINFHNQQTLKIVLFREPNSRILLDHTLRNSRY